MKVLPYAFIMPIRFGRIQSQLQLLKLVIESIFGSSDDRWILVMIDDHSAESIEKNYIQKLADDYPDKVTLLNSRKQRGPGYCRNLGIQFACEKKIPVVMFNDSDDIPHRDRVKVTRERFLNRTDSMVLYSTFIPIDGNANEVPTERLTPSLLEILEAHDPAPEGNELWKTIGTKTGYVNLNSSTAVSTELAVREPFPEESVSEDSHTWMRYSASGAEFVFDERIPVRYRVMVDDGTSSSRSEHGDRFYFEKARVDEDGFRRSLELALKRGVIAEADIGILMVQFFVRLAETLIKEHAYQVAERILASARSSNLAAYERMVKGNAVVSDYLGTAHRQ